MAVSAQGKAEFLCLEAGGLLADREGGEVEFYWGEISDGFQAGLEGGKGFTEWVPSMPDCELALH